MIIHLCLKSLLTVFTTSERDINILKVLSHVSFVRMQPCFVISLSSKKRTDVISHPGKVNQPVNVPLVTSKMHLTSESSRDGMSRAQMDGVRSGLTEYNIDIEVTMHLCSYSLHSI